VQRNNVVITVANLRIMLKSKSASSLLTGSFCLNLTGTDRVTNPSELASVVFAIEECGIVCRGSTV
jgi:hypothetical protein